ncbi:MAG: hypothetical protein KGN79_14955 [Acidobacteriota bacterium]|nr:hypothetical protein [Acidobacteriota bacterium]
MMFFVGLTGFAVLLQSVVLFALYLTIRKTSKAVQDEVAELRSVVVPVMNESRAFLKNVAPKIEAAAKDLAELTDSLYAQTEDLEKTTADLLERLRRHSARVDVILGRVLDGVDQAGAMVVQTVGKPVRQAQGLLASARAFLGVMRSGVPAQAETHVSSDRDMFV